jgi:hypothetical protein
MIARLRTVRCAGAWKCLTVICPELQSVTSGNPLHRSSYDTNHLEHQKTVHFPHKVYLTASYDSQYAAITSLNSTNRLIFVTDGVFSVRQQLNSFTQYLHELLTSGLLNPNVTGESQNYFILNVHPCT